MEKRRLPRRILAQNKRLASLKKNTSEYAVGKESKQDLSPLHRLQKFKKLQERQARSNNSFPKKQVGVKKVTFKIGNMTTEEVIMNGSHEPKTDDKKDEKILKPRKSILSNEQEKVVYQNGSSENESISGSVENENIENGYAEEVKNDDSSKQVTKRNLRQRKESTPVPDTPNKRELRRRENTPRELTPKPETPNKRELRKRESVPREATPRLEAPHKKDTKRHDTPAKVLPPSENGTQDIFSDNDEKRQNIVNENKASPESSKQDGENEKTEKRTSVKSEESLIIIDDSQNGESVQVVSFTDSEEEIVIKEKSESKSLFSSVFRKSFNRRTSTELKDACEASSSSPSIICLDSPPNTSEKIVPNKDIKARKPINAFARFPGRNVSITSLDKSHDKSSLKRKADDSFGDEEPKRFAGLTESGSEKSPGWNFFSSPFPRVWSPASEKPTTSLSSSTPFYKKREDSMAVNYNSETKISLDDSVEFQTESIKEHPTPKPQPGKWCSIM